MKVKEISYFYPTSHYSKKFQLPKGGYYVEVRDTCLVPFDGRVSVEAFSTFADAKAYAQSLSYPWGVNTIQQHEEIYHK